MAVGELVLQSCLLDQPLATAAATPSMVPADLARVHAITSEGAALSLLDCWRCGCLVSGVTLQGARWDAAHGCLAEAAPTHVFCPLPLLWLVPVREAAGPPASAQRSSWRLARVAAESEAVYAAGSRVQAAAREQGGGVLARTPQEDPRGACSPRADPDTHPAGALLGQPILAASQPPQRPSPAMQAVLSGSFPWGPHGPPSALELAQRYRCPAYLHSHTYGGRISNRGTDVEDCLFELLLPAGPFSPIHWTTRNVALLVTSNLAQLDTLQNT